MEYMNSVTVALACAASVFGAAFVAALLALRKARQSAADCSAEVQRLGMENATLSATLAARDESVAKTLAEKDAAANARLADKDRACEERLAELRHTLEETIARLRSEFAALAADKLEEKSGLLSERNAKDVKPLFDALRQNIDEFRKAAESTRESNVKLGGVLSALRVLCSPGDNVLFHSPTYIGFTNAAGTCGYHMIHSALKKDEDGIWRMDLADMEKKIVDRIFIRR